MTDPKQQLLRLLKSYESCSYCKGWGKIWFKQSKMESGAIFISIVDVIPKWGYNGFLVPVLGFMSPDPSAKCPVCKGSGKGEFK